MAVQAWQTFFPNGRGLQDGAKLTRLFTGQQQIRAINVSSGATVAGGVTLTGALKTPATQVKAIGASQASATVVPTGAVNVWVTTSTSAEGIALFALASGQSLTVWPMPTIGVKVFAHAGQVINALASTVALALASAKPATFFSDDGVHIRAQKGA